MKVKCQGRVQAQFSLCLKMPGIPRLKVAGENLKGTEVLFLKEVIIAANNKFASNSRNTHILWYNRRSLRDLETTI